MKQLNQTDFELSGFTVYAVDHIHVHVHTHAHSHAILVEPFSIQFDEHQCVSAGPCNMYDCYTLGTAKTRDETCIHGQVDNNPPQI